MALLCSYFQLSRYEARIGVALLALDTIRDNGVFRNVGSLFNFNWSLVFSSSKHCTNSLTHPVLKPNKNELKLNSQQKSQSDSSHWQCEIEQ